MRSTTGGFRAAACGSYDKHALGSDAGRRSVSRHDDGRIVFRQYFLFDVPSEHEIGIAAVRASDFSGREAVAGKEDVSDFRPWNLRYVRAAPYSAP